MQRSASIAILAIAVSILAATPTHAEISHLTVHVDGMSCPFCTFNVEKKLKPLRNVEDVDIDLKTGNVAMRLGKGQGPAVAEIRRAVREAGFTPGAIGLRAVGTLTVKNNYILLHVRPPIEGGEPQYRAFYLYQPGQGDKKFFDEKTRSRLEGLASEKAVVAITGGVHEHAEGLPALSTDKIKVLPKDDRTAQTRNGERSE